MASSEKDPKDSSKERPDMPKLDAILPDQPSLSSAEFADDISAYQQKMEEEWETAKNTYEEKINRIMNDFVTEGMAKLNDPNETRSESASTPSPTGSTKNLSDLIGQLEKELHGTSRRPQTHPEFLSPKDAARLSLGWRKSFPLVSNRLRVAVACAILLMLGIGSFWATLWRTVQTPLPYAHTLGPIVSNHKIYIMDWFRKTLFVHSDDSTLMIKSVEALPNSLASGIAMSDKTLWSLDSLDLKLNLHNVTIDHQVTDSVATPDQRPVGLYFDGTDLWSADQDTYKLFRHRGNDVGEVRDTYPLPDITITTFLLKKTQLWILDGKARLIYVYRLQRPLLKLASYDLDPLLKQATPTGMALDGQTLLVTTENPASLIRIPLFRLKHSRLSLTD